MAIRPFGRPESFEGSHPPTPILYYPKPPPPAHAGHIARDFGLGRPEKGHVHDMPIDGQGRADDLLPHIPEIVAHPGGFVAFFVASRRLAKSMRISPAGYRLLSTWIDNSLNWTYSKNVGL